ncbi:MAG TPA: FMN-binding protein, partial [Bacteroidales bacterium]|nr:FMN-binding protein [Bacteroidales bacterium]
LKSDFNTIYGAMFDHKGETPGLGAEIGQQWFIEPFKGKTIFDQNGKFTSIQIIKGGAADDNPHGVDAISGGTITSKGVEKMIFDNLGSYQAFIQTHKNH